MLDIPQHRRCATRLPQRSLAATVLAAVALLVVAGQCAAKSAKVGVFFERSPDATIAPLHDEVLFECELNLSPERLEWRFRPASVVSVVPAGGGGTRAHQHQEYVYLNKSDGYLISINGGLSKLRIDVGPNSAGDYQCVAWYGAAAVASIPARLTLASIALDAMRAQIDAEQQATSATATTASAAAGTAESSWHVQAGNAVLVKCAAVVSNPPAVWSFYKDNKLVPSQLSNAPTLILQNVQPADSGTYTCAAVNSITRTELRMPHRLSLRVDEHTARAAPSLLLAGATAATTRFQARAGAVALLECPGHGNPLPKAVWSRPDANLYRNRTAVLAYGLRIADVQPSDAGPYVCRLDNGIAPALVHTVRLDVLQAPHIVEGPADRMAAEGVDVQLDCAVRGWPQPEVYWTINGADTRADASVALLMNGTRMAIRQVQKRHAGIVQCFARNAVAEVSELALLEVIPKQIPGVEMDGSELDGLQSNGGANDEDESGSPFGAMAVAQASRHSMREQQQQQQQEHGGGRNGNGGGGGGGKGKGHNKHKHIMIPPSAPSVTRLADDKVMVRWSVPTTKAAHLPIQFFKVQYRILGDVTRTVQRSIWMTSNEDIPAQVNMYEVENLRPDHFYRFRIAAVYSNNDNKLSNVSTKFLLQRRSQLDPIKSNLLAPNLTSVEAISQTAVMLHWNMPTTHGRGAAASTAVDGFYAYYRPASTAGEYSKATVDGMHARRFKIDKLEPGTAYEFKLQSFTASAASDFLAILTGKTLTPSTPAPFPQDVRTNETVPSTKPVKPSYLPLIAGVAGASALLLLAGIGICVCIKRRRGADGDDDADENKSHPPHPDHIQAEPNGYANGGNNGRSLQKPSNANGGVGRLNGGGPRMNITANPVSDHHHSNLGHHLQTGLSNGLVGGGGAGGGSNGDKNRNVMEMRFMPSSNPAAAQQPNGPSPATSSNAIATTVISAPPSPVGAAAAAAVAVPRTPPPVPQHATTNGVGLPPNGLGGNHLHHSHHHAHHHHGGRGELPPQHPNHHQRQSPTSPEAMRRTLERSHRNLNGTNGHAHHYESAGAGDVQANGGSNNGAQVNGNGAFLASSTGQPPLRRGTMSNAMVAGAGSGGNAAGGMRHIPGSPRLMRAGGFISSTELLKQQCQRSPMPQRSNAAAVAAAAAAAANIGAVLPGKRGRLGSRSAAESHHRSSGSLNSIEV